MARPSDAGRRKIHVVIGDGYSSSVSTREAQVADVQALRQAALELFAAQGFDTTTTEEIAERAGVSVRTFFRYFPTKELVLFFGRYDFVQAFVANLLSRPRSSSDFDAMRGGVHRRGIRICRAAQGPSSL